MNSLNKKYVFIAGGIGITPFHSILGQLDFENKNPDITLLYSNSNKDFVFKDEIENFAKRNKRLKIVYIVSPKRVDKKILSKFPKASFFYISGPDPMVEAIEKELLELRVSKKNLYSDYFSGYKKI